MGLAHVGRAFGLSRERVRQIEVRALLKLQHSRLPTNRTSDLRTSRRAERRRLVPVGAGGQPRALEGGELGATPSDRVTGAAGPRDSSRFCVRTVRAASVSSQSGDTT